MISDGHPFNLQSSILNPEFKEYSLEGVYLQG